jgi:hypothetical protein
MFVWSIYGNSGLIYTFEKLQIILFGKEKVRNEYFYWYY